MAVASRAHPPVYFVRHGETDYNKQGLIQGWIDTALNATGHRQAQAVAAALARVAALEPSFNFVVSPLTRARQTMGYVAEALGLEPEQIVISAAVKELGFGVWEGKPFWQLKDWALYPADAESRYRWRPEGGESYADGEARMAAFLGTLTGPTVIVAHGAIGRCLIARSAGLTATQLVALRTPQGCYCRLANGQIDWFDANGDAA
jgi:probable phosphoglycerate mutase